MRLSDPEGLVNPKQLEDLIRKIDYAMTVLSRPIHYGGHPFLYSFAVTKEHVLSCTWKKKKEYMPRCYTDGDKFYWNPAYLDSLTVRQVPVVMEHETIHLVSEHAQRGVNKKNFNAWQAAIDFYTNGRMVSDYKKTNPLIKDRLGDFPCISDGSFGDVVDIKMLKDIACGLEPGPTWAIFCDENCIERSPEDIYEEILPYFPEPDNDDGEEGSNKNDLESDSEETNDTQGSIPDEEGFPSNEGSDGDESNQVQTLDCHTADTIDTQQLMEEIMVAMERAEAMDPGSTPSYLKDALSELEEPSVDLSEHIRMKSIKITMDGMRNQWKRPRKRSWAIGQYLPKRTGNTARWVCLLDTSGSMTDEAISYGISQLKSLGGETTGVVVPVDAVVHWEEVTEIEAMDDLQEVSVIGRGGTVFNEFFEKYEEELGEEFDLVIVITDGFCGAIPENLSPSCDCIWAITERSNFEPPFGEAIKIWQNLR